MLPRILAATFLALTLAVAPTQAQSPQPAAREKTQRKFIEKPLWITWHTGFSEQGMMQYIQSVSEQTGIADDLADEIRTEIEKERPGARPVKGTAMFLVQGLIPGVETLDFRELKDKAEFDKIIKERQLQYGGKEAKITGLGNFKHVEYTHVYESPKYEMKTTINDDGTTKQEWLPAIDKDGKPVMQKNEWKQSTSFRLEKGVLFEGNFDELEDMKLPSADKLGLGRRRHTEDLYFHADVKMVPKGLKTIAWNLVSAQANMMMQQRDSENQIPYEFRKSVSDVGVEFLRSVFFDIEEATGSIKFATDTKPLRADFNMKVRSSSSMAKQLRAMGEGRSRLPADKEAVISFRSTWAMPKAFQKMLSTAAPYLRSVAEEEIQDDKAIAGVNGIADALEGSAEQGDFETIVNFGGIEASGPVLYGAVRADKGDRLSTGLQAILQFALNSQSGPNLPTIDTLEGAEGRQYVRIAFPDMQVGTELKPEYAYLTGDKGAVWFAVGRKNAWQMLEHKMAQKKAKRGRSALASLKIDMARFLDPDDPAGLGELGKQLDLEFDKLAAREPAYGDEPDMKKVKLPPYRALLDVALKGGQTKMSISIDSDKKGLFVKAEIGEAIGRYLTARYMSSVNRSLARRQAYMELQMEKQKLQIQEAAERATEAAGDSK